ncbi:hypothetical protein [Paenibacillus pinistramenti]|uniref:hypothetical protein n=1 Tax=Paenibacillus pinistramenti TaxID=1768003 RepID=UPI001108613C|nr:hypothetical protein [Paenibacillus pinistramenti]
MKHYDSSLHTNNTNSRAQVSINKLTNAVSQALSHPTEQMIEQAENRLVHTEQAVSEAQEHSADGQGVDLLEAALNEEKERLQSARDAVSYE